MGHVKNVSHTYHNVIDLHTEGASYVNLCLAYTQQLKQAVYVCNHDGCGEINYAL